jgi:hypothetical protein
LVSVDRGDISEWLARANAATAFLQCSQYDVAQRISRTKSIDTTWLRACSAPFSTSAECAGTLGWAWGVGSGTLRFEEGDATAVAQLSNKPATAIWGMQDPTLLAKYLLPLFQKAFPKSSDLANSGGAISPTKTRRKRLACSSNNF